MPNAQLTPEKDCLRTDFPKAGPRSNVPVEMGLVRAAPKQGSQRVAQVLGEAYILQAAALLIDGKNGRLGTSWHLGLDVALQELHSNCGARLFVSGSVMLNGQEGQGDAVITRPPGNSTPLHKKL
mgnify:CR=1 FL=1